MTRIQDIKKVSMDLAKQDKHFEEWRNTITFRDEIKGIVENSNYMNDSEKTHRICMLIMSKLKLLKDENYLSERFDINKEVNSIKARFNSNINQTIQDLE